MKNSNKNELVITRIFDAPRELVWKMWTDEEMMKKWWGPKIFSCPVCTIDFRVGGTYFSCMRDEKGNNFWSTGTYKEIIPLEKIVATDSFADEKGNVVPSTHYGMEGFPLEMLVTVTFEEQGNKTKMTLVHSDIENIDEKSREGMEQGWSESFDKLATSMK